MNTWVGMALVLMVGGQEEQDKQTHDELRALRDALVTAIEKQDIIEMTKYVTPDVVVTWQNGEVCHGVDELKEFFARMQGGQDKAWRGYKVPPTADKLTVLYGGDGGVAAGYHVGTFMIAGKELELKNRWTATVVKRDGRWVVASYHVSMNVLDNALLNGVKAVAFWGPLIALLIGVFGTLGVRAIIARVRSRQANR